MAGDVMRRAAAEAVARRVQACIVSGPENADPLPPDLLAYLNEAGFFTRAQFEEVALSLAEADRLAQGIMGAARPRSAEPATEPAAGQP